MDFINLNQLAKETSPSNHSYLYSKLRFANKGAQVLTKDEILSLETVIYKKTMQFIEKLKKSEMEVKHD